MNELQVFSKEVIPVYETEEGNKVVVGRELYEQLGISSKYADWFKNMCAYGFDENKDWTSFSKNLENGGRRIEHVLTLDMAKHIAVIQRTPQGHAIRQKLIELEQQVRQQQLTPMSPLELLEAQVQAMKELQNKQEQQSKALEATNSRIDEIRDVVAINPQSWREECRRMIVKIAQSMGGNEYIKDVQAEIYRLVDVRGAARLAVRLTNKRREMAENGVGKSKRAKVNKVDVIAGDKRLIEIYIAIVKEMAIKYGVAAA